ncbi:uncharacterized protein [Onthophagus taurus]|uniref:uncharacterized protein n=1 Tax=Onthophagus taurus TaxID=166361 RepID=UPI0039BE310C
MELLWQNKSVDFKSYPIKNTSASKIVWQNITRFGWLVNTDYLYCSWYICIPDHAEKGIAFITTKEKHPSRATINKSLDSLKKINFDVSKSPVYPINWNQCD